MAIGKFDETAEGRITITTPDIYLRGIKFVVIMTRGSVDTKMLGIEGLDNDCTGFFAAPGSPMRKRRRRKESDSGRRQSRAIDLSERG